MDVVPSSSASQSETTAGDDSDDRGDVSGDGVDRKYNVGRGSGLRQIMALFHWRIRDPVRSSGDWLAFLLMERLRPGLYEIESVRSGRATLTEGPRKLRGSAGEKRAVHVMLVDDDDDDEDEDGE